MSRRCLIIQGKYFGPMSPTRADLDIPAAYPPRLERPRHHWGDLTPEGRRSEFIANPHPRDSRQILSNLRRHGSSHRNSRRVRLFSEAAEKNITLQRPFIAERQLGSGTHGPAGKRLCDGRTKWTGHRADTKPRAGGTSRVLLESIPNQPTGDVGHPPTHVVTDPGAHSAQLADLARLGQEVAIPDEIIEPAK